MGPDNEKTIRSSIISDMSEGVMAIRCDGRIMLVNDAALHILEMDRQQLEGRSFAACFFGEERNDAFTETVLEAVRSRGRRLETYVPYYTETACRQLRVVSSYLKQGEERIGVILVISDITELAGLKDAVRAMEAIQDLNKKLEIRNRLLQDTFGRYLSDDIVREILDTPDGMRLGGHRRRVTILMSDLRGFTMMCARMDAEDLVAMLNHYFSVMYEEISRYGGTVIEFLGDGMFILFGAPVPSSRHASDAAACALAMQKRMEEVNGWNRERGYPFLSMGIGINTDEVILGNIGSEKRTKYGVMGPAVNLAGRIESYTTDGQVLLSGTSLEAIPERLEIADSFPVFPKGVETPVTVFHLTGIGGGYGIFLEEKEEALTALPEPLPVTFRVLSGKHVEEETFRGLLLALSDQGALVQTGTPLQVRDDLVLDLGGDAYAKVRDRRDGRIRIVFTARPAGFSAFLKAAGGDSHA